MEPREVAVGVPRGAFRPSAIFLAIAALFVAGATMSWTAFGNPSFNVFLFVVAGWLLSLCLHEYAHALVAYAGGDVSVAARGYLTLNPLKYSHPLLSIGLPVLFVMLGGIGLPGGAVSVERHSLRSRAWESLVSFAGPAVNIAFTLLLVAPFVLGATTVGPVEFWAGLAFLAFLQVTASLLNLMPIPGVDGGNLIEPWLSPSWRRGFAKVAPFGFLLLIALLWEPRINRFFFTVVFWLSDRLGLPVGLYREGLDLFRFWS
jgi:Zn-dependent protease